MKEIKNLRKKNEKHFLNDDGTITAYIYNNDIHYLNNGIYEDIDLNIIEEDSFYSNRKNAFSSFFGKNNKDNLLINIKKDNYYLKIYLDNKTNEYIIENKDKEIYYKNILDNIDFKYQILSGKIKESIILKNKNNISNLSFKIDTNLLLKINNKYIEAKDKENVIFKLAHPFMIDDNKEYNENITYKLIKKEKGYLLSLNLDRNWLESDDRKYPIIIDPTIINPSETEDVYDTYINNELPNDNFDFSDHLGLGPKENNTIDRILLKFNLPTIGTGYDIIDAKCYLESYTKNALPTVENYLASIHEVTTSWSEDSVTWNDLINNYNDNIEDFTRLNTYNLNSFDITNLVKKWYAGSPNNGVLIKYVDETYSENNRIILLASKTYDYLNNTTKRPFLVITYRNQNGIEDYMTYQIQNYTDGRSHINNLTGNLTTIFNLNETIGGKYPVGLSMIYNTNDVVLNNDYGYGLGFKLNLHETIKEVEIDNIDYLEYMDADGTIHYFINENKEYIDEDGLGLSAVKNNNSIIVNDKSNNKYIFTLNNNIYYLTKLINTNEDEVNITYNNSKILKITDANNEEINLTYNPDNITITSPSKTTIVNYDNNKISSIITKNGETTFTYNENNIIDKITDPSGLAKEYLYYNVSPYKVKKVVEYGLNNEEGTSLTFTYKNKTTKIKDNKNRFNIYTFNNEGNTIGITNLKDDNLNDAYGKGYVYNYRTKISNSEEINKASNKLATEILPVKYVKNYFKNGGFEYISEAGNHEDQTVEDKRNGKQSIKIDGFSYLTTELPSNKTYTFSGYIKSNNEVTYKAETDADAMGPYQLCEGAVPASDDFKRFSFTFTLPENKHNLSIDFTVDGVAYLDDVQIEEGIIPNYINLIDNGDFTNNLVGWNTEGFDANDKVITLSSGIKALKINPKINTYKTLEKTINVSGKKTTDKPGIGDIYYLSFWYKNTGIYKSSDMVLGSNGNCVQLSFKYPEDYAYGSGTKKYDLIPANDEWQFFSAPFYTDSVTDYENIYFTLFATDNVNELLITNISVTKEVEQVYHNYNEETGNLESTLSKNKDKNEFKYDKNNELTAMFNPMGNNYSFEYDNNIQDRILKGISPSGISNEILYDSFGNPIKTIINNVNPDNEIVANKNYMIRLKGTKKYLDCNFLNKQIYLKEDTCSHDAFKVEKDDDYYRFKIGNEYITYNNTNIILTNNISDSCLFKLEKNDNGSYTLIPKLNLNTKLTYINDSLKFENNGNTEFYFEDIETNKYIANEALYTEDGKFIKKTIDALGRITEYDINTTNGLTNSITDPNNVTTYYTYNNKDQITKVKKDNKEVNYTYNNNNLLSKISTSNKDYLFNYDNYLNISNIKINNNTLVNNEYEPNNGNLIKTTYGNNDIISYTYDELDRIKTITKGSTTYTNTYDNTGNVALMTDGSYLHKYYYDEKNRLTRYMKEQEYFGNDYNITYSYDKNNNIIKKVYNKENIDYEYNKDDAITKVSFNNNNINYAYDYLGRLTKKDINNNYNIEYKYLENGNKTSTIIKETKINNDIYKYKYDKLYNITDKYLNNELINHYEYDNFNELIKEDDYINNKTITYTYDNEGNILTKKEYELNTENLLNTNTYEYENTYFKDELTKYNNDLITYDEIGNPITIGNKTLTWKNGRELSSIKEEDKEVVYSYDINGIRKGKYIKDIGSILYYTENNKIIFEKRPNYMIYYIRDEEGNLIGFKYNNEIYYYKKNIEEDIIGIIDSNNNEVASYEYDSWGKILSIKDINKNEITDSSHIALINPFRYRSYYYDEETGYYYLNSRYYNPEWGRFINCDNFIKAEENVYNLYTYCKNNPIKYIDTNGNSAAATAGILGGLGASSAGAIAAALGSIITVALPIAVGILGITAVHELSQVDWTSSTTHEDNKNKGNHTVYVLINPNVQYANGENKVEYVGRTTDIQRRKIAHQTNPYKSTLIFKEKETNLDYATARGLEERLIMKYKTLNKGNYMNNQIHGISPNNKNYNFYMRAADRYFTDETYVGGSEW